MMLAGFQQKIWQLRSYKDVQQLFRACPSEPLLVDKLTAEWCFAFGLKDEAAKHCIQPIVHGLKHPNPFYDDVLDANSIGQCIYLLFNTRYTGQPFHRMFPPGLDVWGKLFCLAYCYLSKSIDLLEKDTSRVLFEPYEARAVLTMKFLSPCFDPSIPYMMLTEMAACDCLRTAEIYQRLGYGEDYDKWVAMAEAFANKNEPGRLDSEPLQALARKGQDTMRGFYREREQNFIKNMYACTATEVTALAEGR